MIRVYAKTVGVVLVLLGLAGLTGVVDTVRPTDLFHVGVGVIFTYLGFLQRDAVVVRTVVGGMGLLLLLAKGVVLLVPLLWGEAPFHGPIEITCLVVGFLSVLAARYLRDSASTAGG